MTLKASYRHWLGLLGLLLSLGACVSTSGQKEGSRRQAAASRALWFEGSLGEARRHALQEGKLLLLYFYRPDCRECLRLEWEVLQQPDFSERASMVVPVKVSAESIYHPEYSRSFPAATYPALVLADAQGLELFRFDPNLGPEAFAQAFALAVTSNGPWDQVLHQLKQGDAAPNIWRLAAWYDWRSPVTAGYTDTRRFLDDLQQLTERFPVDYETEKAHLTAHLLLSFAEWGADHPARDQVRAFGQYFWGSLLINESLIASVQEPFLRSSRKIALFLYPQTGTERERFVSRYRLAVRDFASQTSRHRLAYLWTIRADIDLTGLTHRADNMSYTHFALEIDEIWKGYASRLGPSSQRTLYVTDIADLYLVMGRPSDAVTVLMAGLESDPQSAVIQGQLALLQPSSPPKPSNAPKEGRNPSDQPSSPKSGKPDKPAPTTTGKPGPSTSH